MRASILSVGTAAIGMGIASLGSNMYQLDRIHKDAESVRQTVSPNNTVEQDIQEIMDATSHVIRYYGGGCEFVRGDFDNRNGEARCGGIAKEVCMQAAARGFETRIELEIVGPLRWHYYAVISRDGQTFRIDGSPSTLFAESWDGH